MLITYMKVIDMGGAHSQGGSAKVANSVTSNNAWHSGIIKRNDRDGFKSDARKLRIPRLNNFGSQKEDSFEEVSATAEPEPQVTDDKSEDFSEKKNEERE
ncbi:hypothetical protein [Halobacillus sp. Marseille-Q1614]|uniref:hypothetical protein n=1 Tax=Halobacillus sp. Marseille-Q1614 TaxID=2709134 RepID=UPI0020C1ED71